MHELSIADAIVRIALRARGRAPDRDRRGQGRAPAPGRARRAGRSRSTLVAEGTEAEGAELLLEEVPAAGICRVCGIESELPGFPLACEACGSLDVELVRGEELLVDALTMEGVPSGRS